MVLGMRRIIYVGGLDKKIHAYEKGILQNESSAGELHCWVLGSSGIINTKFNVMEAPKKIYLQVCGDCPQTDCKSCKFEDLEDNITWCKDRIFPKDIQYIRTDVVIEKIEEFIYSALNSGIMCTANIEDFMKLFRNHIKRE